MKLQGEAKQEEKTGSKVSGAKSPLVWVVVVSKPGQERLAVANLEDQDRRLKAFGEGFEIYLPLRLSANRKQELVAAPFFPRYLFARVDLGISGWKRIWSTRGVHGMLGSPSGRPFGVADWVIERLRAEEDAGYIRMGLLEERAKAMGFQEGRAVRVAGTPLEAVFVELVDEKRATILVSLLGRDSRLTVDIAKLRATGTD